MIEFVPYLVFILRQFPIKLHCIHLLVDARLQCNCTVYKTVYKHTSSESIMRDVHFFIARFGVHTTLHRYRTN